MADREAMKTPVEGLVLRGSPDASAEPSVRLEGTQRVTVLERWGSWAKVEAGDGLVGWVDGRRLIADVRRLATQAAPESGMTPRYGRMSKPKGYTVALVVCVAVGVVLQVPAFAVERQVAVTAAFFLFVFLSKFLTGSWPVLFDNKK